ncbi:23618_t:CDS:2, partial [Gigaspora rosea]
MTLNRLNVSWACDTCKSLKTKCDRVVSTVSTTKCTQCIKHSSNEIYNEDEIFHGLSAEEKKYFSSTYSKEQLIQILKILRSFTPQPCPFKNIRYITLPFDEEALNLWDMFIMPWPPDILI